MMRPIGPILYVKGEPSMVHEEGPDDIVENCHDCESEKAGWQLGRETLNS
jgi:hypothetical protein